MLTEIHERHTWAGRAVVVVRRHHPLCLHVQHPERWMCTCQPVVVRRDEVPNLITTAGRNLLRDHLMGALADAKVRYFGLGTSSTAPAIGQTQLVAETFRKITTSYAAGGAGEAVNTCFVAPNEAVFNIQEVGFFAGAGATATANSGVMVARVLYSHVKTALESIQIDRHDQF